MPGEESLVRALPSWEQAPTVFGQLAGDERPLAQWRIASPVAFGCRSCTARRTGELERTVRYLPRWKRVCVRHQRWLLDAGDSHDLEYLGMTECPEVSAAQQRWAQVARRAVRADVEVDQVFGVARAVVCRWWDRALEWELERVWPARLHRVAGGDAGAEFWWWRAVGRDAVVFPELVTVADALLDPVMQELVWRDSGAERPRVRRPDGLFARELGERLGRPWLGPLAALDAAGPLGAWIGAVVRRRRGVGVPGGRGQDPWWVQREHQPVSVAAQLRRLAEAEAVRGGGFARVCTQRRGRRVKVFYQPQDGFDLGRWLACRSRSAAGAPASAR